MTGLHIGAIHHKARKGRKLGRQTCASKPGGQRWCTWLQPIVLAMVGRVPRRPEERGTTDAWGLAPQGSADLACGPAGPCLTTNRKQISFLPVGMCSSYHRSQPCVWSCSRSETVFGLLGFPPVWFTECETRPPSCAMLLVEVMQPGSGWLLNLCISLFFLMFTK